MNVFCGEHKELYRQLVCAQRADKRAYNRLNRETVKDRPLLKSLGMAIKIRRMYFWNVRTANVNQYPKDRASIAREIVNMAVAYGGRELASEDKDGTPNKDPQ